MDDIVLAGLAKWPNVPDVFGWLALDARGEWLLKGERIGHAPTRAFIGRNYAHTDDGRWYFQNGPQRVYVALAATPYIARVSDDGSGFVTHNGLVIERVDGWLQDTEGGVVLLTPLGPMRLVDRDLLAASALLPLDEAVETVSLEEIARRYSFVRTPQPPDRS